MKPIKFNPNDPKLWKDFDPTERATEFVGGKSEKSVKISESNKRRWELRDPKYIESLKQGHKKEILAPGYKEKKKQIGERLKQNKDWLEKITKAAQQRSQNPDYLKKRKEIGEKLSKDENFLQKIREAAKKRAKDPKWKEAHKRMCEKRKGSDEWKKIIEKRTNDPNWKIAYAQGVKKRQKRMVTPYGIFDSRIEAAKACGVKPAAMRDRMLRKPDQYYYIDKNGNKIESKK